MNLKELSLYLQDDVQTTLQHTRFLPYVTGSQFGPSNCVSAQTESTYDRMESTYDRCRAPAGSLEKAVKMRVHDTSRTRPRVAGGRVERRGSKEAVKKPLRNMYSWIACQFEVRTSLGRHLGPIPNPRFFF